MTKITGNMMATKYITEKECSERYGYSTHWFTRKRWAQKAKGEDGPPYVKGKLNGRIMYNRKATDKWFKSNYLIEIN